MATKDLNLGLLTQVNSSTHGASHASTSQGSSSSLREFITNNPDFYRHSCICGIVWPAPEDNLKHSITKYNLRYRIWSSYLHFTLALSIICIIIVGILALSYESVTKEGKATLFCETIGIVIQNAVLYPIVVYLRKNLAANREVDPHLYGPAFGESMKIGQRVLLLCMLSLIAYSIMVVTNLNSDDSSTWSVLSIIAYFVLLTPTQFFLCGILTFLIMEQRISLHAVQTIIAAVDKQSINRSTYMEVRTEMSKRDVHTPLTLLITCAVMNFIISLILIFTYKDAGMSTSTLSLYIFYVAVIFGKEFVVLVLLLLEIVDVNEKCEIFVKNIARSEWSASDTVSEDAQERKRLSLYAAVKEFPVGSAIFYWRPKKFEVSLQLLSMILSAAAAVFWAFTL